jgi:hypothetical protein
MATRKVAGVPLHELRMEVKQAAEKETESNGLYCAGSCGLRGDRAVHEEECP